MMNIRYPVRKADGRDYKNYDEPLDKKAALKSAFWGKFQILASNYATTGYASPEDFVLVKKCS
ncbi:MULTISPECIES: N-acetylmuramidase domain-containing protein [Escherichia]|uniref:N-acetylmuramidase domain-containing protein n=2 Tax=Escherichia TaxID=561 RepID=UPI0030153FAA